MRVVVGQSRVRREDATSLLVRVAAGTSGAPRASRNGLEAAITVSIADARLARTMTQAIATAVRAAGDVPVTAAPPLVRLRTRKRLALLAPETLAGAIAVVQVTHRNARRLVEIVDGLRAGRALAVQMVWDGQNPPRSHVERHVFAVLERARSTPSGPPVVLAKSDEPAEALRIDLANRLKKDNRS